MEEDVDEYVYLVRLDVHAATERGGRGDISEGSNENTRTRRKKGDLFDSGVYRAIGLHDDLGTERDAQGSKR